MNKEQGFREAVDAFRQYARLIEQVTHGHQSPRLVLSRDLSGAVVEATRPDLIYFRFYHDLDLAIKCLLVVGRMSLPLSDMLLSYVEERDFLEWNDGCRLEYSVFRDIIWVLTHEQEMSYAQAVTLAIQGEQWELVERSVGHYEWVFLPLHPEERSAE